MVDFGRKSFQFVLHTKVQGNTPGNQWSSVALLVTAQPVKLRELSGSVRKIVWPVVSSMLSKLAAHAGALRGSAAPLCGKASPFGTAKL